MFRPPGRACDACPARSHAQRLPHRYLIPSRASRVLIPAPTISLRPRPLFRHPPLPLPSPRLLLRRSTRAAPPAHASAALALDPSAALYSSRQWKGTTPWRASTSSLPAPVAPRGRRRRFCVSQIADKAAHLVEVGGTTCTTGLAEDVLEQSSFPYDASFSPYMSKLRKELLQKFSSFDANLRISGSKVLFI